MVIYLTIGLLGLATLLIPALFEIRHKLLPAEEKKKKNRVTTKSTKGKLNFYGKLLIACAFTSYVLSGIQFKNDLTDKSKMSNKIDTLNDNSKKIYEALAKHNLTIDANFRIIPISTTNVVGSGMQLNNNVISDNVYGIIQNQIEPRVIDSLEKEIRRQQIKDQLNQRQ